MLKKNKYVSSGGLAFSEHKDMEKLSRYAREGWELEGFAPFGYKLKKSKPQDVVYSYDYRPDADEEYFMIFTEAGWEHVTSSGDSLHIFKAPAGTVPIYSEEDSLIERYKQEKANCGKMALPLLIATILLFALSTFEMAAYFNIASFILGVISLCLLVFPGLPYLSYSVKLYKFKSK